jgi:hypothetical protein
MTERIQKDELARWLAERMHTDIPTAKAWIDGVVETLYESFQAGESTTITQTAIGVPAEQAAVADAAARRARSARF